MMSSSAYAVSNNISLLPFADQAINLKVNYTGYGNPTASNIGFASGLKFSEKLAIGLTASHIGHSEYEISSETGTSKGAFTPYDLKLGVGTGLKITEKFSAGLSLFCLNETITENFKLNAISADLLVSVQFNNILVSGGLKSFGTPVKDSEGTAFGLPSSIFIGALYGNDLGETGKIKASVDADYYLEGGLGASLGAAYTWKDMLSVRAGARYGGQTVIPSGVSAGLGFKFSGISIDAAYMVGLGKIKANTVCVNLGYSF